MPLLQTESVTKRLAGEDQNTCLLPAWSSSSSQHPLGNYFANLANIYTPASFPTCTVLPGSLVSQYLGSGLPLDAGPPRLGNFT